MQIAAYEFITPAGRYAISLRPYGRWRVRCVRGVIDRSFVTAEEALVELLQTNPPVPHALDDWTALATHTETNFGELDP